MMHSQQHIRGHEHCHAGANLMQWADVRVYCLATEIVVSGNMSDLFRQEVDHVAIARVGIPETYVRFTPTEQRASESALQQLQALARRNQPPSSNAGGAHLPT